MYVCGCPKISFNLPKMIPQWLLRQVVLEDNNLQTITNLWCKTLRPFSAVACCITHVRSPRICFRDHKSLLLYSLYGYSMVGSLLENTLWQLETGDFLEKNHYFYIWIHSSHYFMHLCTFHSCTFLLIPGLLVLCYPHDSVHSRIMALATAGSPDQTKHP